MRAIKIDENRDPVIINGKFVWVFDADVVLQNCEQAMRQQLGELNYDANKGVQYFDNIFTGNPNFQRFEAQARTQLLNVDGVTGIDGFSFDFIGGVLSYNADISTIYGSTTVATSI
jgi:hypothetical protein